MTACSPDGSCQHRRWRGLWRHVQDDITRFLNKSPENQAVGDSFKSRCGALLTPQLMCLVLYRLAHALHLRGWPRLAQLPVRLNGWLHRVHISADSCIGPGCLLPHPVGVFFIGRAGAGLTLYSMAVCGPLSPSPTAPALSGPLLGRRVTVGVQAVLMGPLVVGDDSKVGPRAMVRADVPAGAIAMTKHWRTKVGGTA